MTALEIVMVSVASILVLAIIVYIGVNVYISRFKINKVRSYREIDSLNGKKSIVFLGDSLTDFYPIHEFINCDKIANRGIGGDTTKNVMNRLEEVIKLSPKLVFLQIGINDMIYRRVKCEVVAERIMKIANDLREKGIKVYVISLYPINRRKMALSWLLCRHASNKKVIAVNKLLLEKCNKEGIPYIDMHSELVDKKGNLRSTFTTEGLHISTKGYKKVTIVLKKYLEEELKCIL